MVGMDLTYILMLNSFALGGFFGFAVTELCRKQSPPEQRG